MRMKKVLDILDRDKGLEDSLFKVLSKRKELSLQSDVNINLCCLNVISTLNLSHNKWDDLRFWIIDMVSQGVDFTNIPTREVLRKEVEKPSPPGVVSSEIKAYISLQDSLHHTGRHFLER